MKTQRHNFIFFLAGCLLAISSIPAQAAAIPIKNFTPTQERVNKNGILISRPVPAQELLKSILTHQPIRTVNDYADWLTKSMTYTTQYSLKAWDFDSQHFLKNRRGDCKDFAALNYQALKMFGFQPHILTLTAVNGGHAICAFQFEGKMYWFDNNVLKSSNATDVKQLGEELTQTLNYLKTQEIHFSTNNTPILAQNS